MKIENLNIYGGSQQFADMIINNSNVLDNTDVHFLRLIHENTNSFEERKVLVDSLETLKSEEANNEAKKKSGGVLKKFINSIATEGGKQLVKELVENGANYWQYII
jgi:riboflavin biosynthesis pyrimidine reductase